MAWPRAFAVLICAATAAVLVAAAAVLLRLRDLDPLELIVITAIALPGIVLGLLIALRRPYNRVAPLLCLSGAAPLVVAGIGDLHVQTVALHPGAVPVWPLLAGLSQGSWMLIYVPAAFMLLVFPDGRLPGPRWRVVAVGLVVVPAAFALVAAADPAGYPPPYQDVAPVLPPLPGALVGPVVVVLLGAFMALLIASAAAAIVRHRRAGDPVLRAQLRWFALGAAGLPLTLLLCWTSYLLLGTADLVMIGVALTALALPAATAIGLLRHDLYDVDRAVSAAATYGLATTLLLAIFTAVSVAGGLIAGRDSAVVAAVATAVSALALTPLRSRLQQRVDARLYPLRRAVRAALDDLRERIDDGRARPEDLEVTLRRALRDPDLRLGYLLPGRPGLVDLDSEPIPAGDGRRVPVRVGTTDVGALLPVSVEASRELLRETAGAVALIVELIRSRLELREALREVADSRSRLLHAGYRERRRLERDLHDGAQQRLVSLGMAIRMAQRHLGDPAYDVDGLLDQAVAELGTAVAELRAIARGLRPLDLDSGLGPAIRSLATALPIPVSLEVCADPVPDDVATTAYYVASEALANVVKHADAASVAVSVVSREGNVHVRISDDGRGGAQPRPGSGLAGLVDRVAAAGGRLAVGPDGLRGTRVEAVLPCAR